MRHRVRLRWREWEHIGASGQVVNWIRHGVRVKFKNGLRPRPFNHGVSMKDATQPQLDFLATELPRFEACGAWERASNPRYVSRMFLVPKPGINKWRLIIDLRELNTYCAEFKMSCETLKHLRHLSRPGDYFVSLDLADGYYTLGIREEDRDFFTVNYRGELWRLACLPMGWSGSAYYFCKLTQVFTNYLRRAPTPMTAGSETPYKPSRRFLRNVRWRGVRLLPYMDDFLFMASSYDAALLLRDRIETLLNRLGLQRNPDKGLWQPTQVGTHLGMTVDLLKGEFRAPIDKLQALAKQASALLGRAATSARWLPARQLAAFAGKAQFLYLAIAPARFFLRELHCVLATRTGWGGRVRMTHQLRRDLEWWRTVPNQHNGRSIYKPIETAYLHADSSGYGWGAVLNDNPAYQARGFWYDDDRQQHITWKELRAVRLAIESFLPQLRGRHVLLHEDNTAVVATLSKLTTRSPVMMTELRRLWHLLDVNDIRIRPRYIRSAANIWADSLSRELDRDDWQLNPRIFDYLQSTWGPHSIDRFASMENAQLPRFNARWRDPKCEDVDCLHLPDTAWQREINYCNPPWSALPDLCAKLRQSGAAATVIAPYWPHAPWFQDLHSSAVETIHYPPSRDLFFPGRLGSREGVGRPGWSVVAFRLPRRPGSTPAGAQ